MILACWQNEQVPTLLRVLTSEAARQISPVVMMTDPVFKGRVSDVLKAFQSHCNKSVKSILSV
jgi:hypothetical protein